MNHNVVSTNKRSQAKVSTVYFFYWQQATIICNMNCLNIQLYTGFTMVSQYFTNQPLINLGDIYISIVSYSTVSCCSMSVLSIGPVSVQFSKQLALLKLEYCPTSFPVCIARGSVSSQLALVLKQAVSPYIKLRVRIAQGSVSVHLIRQSYYEKAKLKLNKVGISILSPHWQDYTITQLCKSVSHKGPYLNRALHRLTVPNTKTHRSLLTC